jgi:hypothetical protein
MINKMRRSGRRNRRKKTNQNAAVFFFCVEWFLENEKRKETQTSRRGLRRQTRKRREIQTASGLMNGVCMFA